jgi:uncharacterized protein
MTTLEVTLTLPDKLAQAARQAGLLTGSALERLIEQALQRQAGQQLLDAMQRLRDANTPPLTEDDVAAAVATDTNVVVSGLLWLGTPGRLLEAAATGQVTLYTSPALIAELSATLAYDKLAHRVQRSGLTHRELLQRYLNVAILVQPTAVPRVVPNDPDDDHVLACALAAHADLIVSGDRKHLLPFGSYEGIPIVSAAEALRRIEMST